MVYSPRNFDYFDTPNPTERGFTVEADESNIIDSPLPDFINDVVTWEQCPRWIRHGCEVEGELRGYRLIHTQKSGQLKRVFYFARVRSDEERLKHFHESWIKRPFSWPTVLLKLWAEYGRIPLSAVDTEGNILNEPSRLVRTRYKPGGMFPTWMRTRHYLSEKPFPKSSSQRVPITDSIHWEFDGMRGGFPECLHPGVVVPNDSTTGAVVFGFGTPTVSIAGDMIQQKYPPTNMHDWQRYVLEDSRNKVVGLMMEHRIVVEVFPPTEFRPPNLATA